MAVISDYEEEEPVQQPRTSTPRQPTSTPRQSTSTPRQSAPPEAVNPPQETRSEPPSQVVANPPVEEPRTPSPVTPAPAPAPAPQADTKSYQHDPVLSTLLEQHKQQPLELLTTVIDFLFRETDLSRESRVEHRVTEIVTAAKRRRSAYDGEDTAPEKVAKVEETKSSAKKEPPSSKTTEPKTPKPKARGNETAESSNVTPSPAANKDSEEPEIDSEGTGLTPNIGNGFDHETYVWTQTLAEATIHIKFPYGTKAKEVACDIKGKTLKAGLKGQEPVLQGEFYTPVKSDDSFWSVDEDGTLSIYVTKCNNMTWWKSVLKGEPEINTRKVMPENSRLDELDLETRSTAEKLMYDQRQKALGLPTSDESSKSDAIKKFMAQHPEMDFSKAKIC
ncbi:hypothetical protein M758_9G066600 [Ceratodon purpureus]|nr:hypothetical protein M758_9G066600 [Ceratodon purpureus]